MMGQWHCEKLVWETSRKYILSNDAGVKTVLNRQSGW